MLEWPHAKRALVNAHSGRFAGRANISKLEDLNPNASVRGILANSLVTVVTVQGFGSEAIELTYKDPAGKVANELLYRHAEPRLGDGRRPAVERRWRRRALAPGF